MGTTRQPVSTVPFVDEYCAAYRDLFEDARSFEHLCLLHLGLISDLLHKPLPDGGQRVGVAPQSHRYFITNVEWILDEGRARPLALTKQTLSDRPFVLVINETGDRKKGKTTGDAARQYIGNLGAVNHGIVSVSAYGVLDDVIFLLLFQFFKTERRLKPGDVYTRPSPPSPSSLCANSSPQASRSSSC